MPAATVWSWFVADRQAVVDVTPVIGRGVRRIDAERRDRVDGLKHFLDLLPAREMQEALAARADMRNGREGFARADRPQDVDAGQDGSVVVGRPADERKEYATDEDRLAELWRAAKRVALRLALRSTDAG
jgi:hypothetical protein